MSQAIADKTKQNYPVHEAELSDDLMLLTSLLVCVSRCHQAFNATTTSHSQVLCLPRHGPPSLISSASSKWLGIGTTVDPRIIQNWYTEIHEREESNIPHAS